MRNLRGNEIAMIFQEPMTSLNPILSCGFQIAETLKLHRSLKKKEAKKEAVKLLDNVGIPNPEKSINRFPHELSGGMRQRVMIAMALACEPDLLIADEPTTALDVTIQAQILDLMSHLIKKLNTSIIFITHDLGVVANFCQRVIIMYGGIIVEQGTIKDIFENPLHPYTHGLLGAVPSLEMDKNNSRLITIPGTPPDLISPPVGCPFYERCNKKMAICNRIQPDLLDASDDHKIRCWLFDQQNPNSRNVKGANV
jgi:oligopeptide transport system ATP-binding protein